MFVADKPVASIDDLVDGSQQLLIRPWAAVKLEMSAGAELAAAAFKAVTLIVLVEDVSVVHTPAPVAIRTFFCVGLSICLF